MRWIGRNVAGRLLRSCALVTVVAACGGGGDDPSPGPTGSIQVSISPASLSVQQGASGTVTVALTRGGGFSGTVSLAVSGLPAGVTVTTTPEQLSGTTTSATINVSVGASVAPGTYTANVRATASGVGEANTSYTLIVTAAPTFALSATPAALSVVQGASGNTTINVARTNFTGGVTLSLVNPPAGITGTFNPAVAVADNAALAIVVAGSVAPGSYTLTVQGTATGPGTRTTTVALTVTAAPSYSLALSPTSVNVAPGANATSTVTLTRDAGFAGAVTLAVDSPPAGITTAFNPASVTGTTSTLTVTVGASVAAGTYTLTIRGTASGVPDRTAQLAVVVAAPTYTLALSPTSLSIQQGNSATSTVTLGRTNFTGNVALSLDTPPAGVTGTFAPGTTNGTTSTLTLNVAGNTAPGSYTLTVRGTASGLTDRTATLALTVTAAPGSIAIAVSPASLSVQQGATGNTSVNITRTNFAGDVTLAASGTPGGTTISFSPNPTTASVSTMTVSAGSGTPAGTYPITVTASGAGVTNATANVSLTISTPSSGGNAEWQFCSTEDVPVFFAVQDGNGPWQRITPTTSGNVTKFNFSLSSSRGGVAYITQINTALVAPDVSATSSRNRITRVRSLMETARRGKQRQPQTYARSSFATTYETSIVYGTATELTGLGTDQCNETQPTKTITGTAAGVGLGQFASISLGGSGVSVVGGGSNALTFRDVRFGTVDLVGARSTLGAAPDKGVIFRNLNIPDGGSLPSVVDFNAASAFTPASATATITNGLGEELITSSQVYTANGESGTFAIDFSAGTGTSRAWSGLPASVFTSGDVHGLFVLASPAGNNPTVSRFMLQYVGAVSNQTLALGPNLTDPTITQVGVGAYPRYRFQGALPTEYRQGTFVTMTTSQSVGNSVNISATGGYLAAVGSASTFDLSMPDISSLSGFPAASRLTAGANEASTSAFGWSGQGILAPRPRAGDLLRAASRIATVSVP